MKYQEVGSQTSSSRSADGGGRRSSALQYVAQKKNFHYFITFFFFFFFTAGYFPTWKQCQGCGFIHLFLHNRCVVFTLQYPIFIHLWPALLSKRNAAACTLCNLRYQRQACRFVWRKRWANSAGYVLTVQCFLSALTAVSKVAASPACVHESASLCSVTGDAGGVINHQAGAEGSTLSDEAGFRGLFRDCFCLQRTEKHD